MFSPSEANDRRRKRKVGGSSKKEVRSVLFSAFEIQQNDVSFAAVDFRNRGLGIRNLVDAIAGVAQNFLQYIAEGFVRIDQQNTLYC